MSSIPPSYEDAVRRDPLPIIAPYLSCHELARASLTCRTWNAAFASYLWGHPMRHFYACSGDDPATFAADTFNAFLQALSHARAATKALVHTVHVPPGSSSDLAVHNVNLVAGLSVLSNLQSLITSNVSQFDHDTVFRLSLAPPVHLRMLIARNCQNVTERGLSEVIPKLPQLQYLDLSYTTAACAPSVVEAIVQSPAITILRLRKVGLKKTELEAIFTSAQASLPGQRHPLRSLDVRDNRIDLSGLSCPRFTRASAPTANSRRHYFDTRKYESTVRKHLANENLKGVKLLDAEPEGITHLYLSGNINRKSKAFRNVLMSMRLRVLDIEYDENINEEPEQNDSWWDPIVHSGNRLTSLRTSLSALLAFDPIQASKARAPSESDAPPSYDAILNEAGLRKPNFISFFPSLTNLTITKVPAVTGANDETVRLIEQLLSSCCAAKSISAERNAPAQSSQKSRPTTQLTQQTFLVEEIVLEIDPRRQKGPVASSNLDPDTEKFRNASGGDFSFFCDENETSLPVKRGHGSGARPDSIGKSRQPEAVDLVQHLTAWRMARRTAWVQSREGRPSGLAAEHWLGKLKVVLTSQSLEAVVQEDCDPFAAFWNSSI